LTVFTFTEPYTYWIILNTRKYPLSEPKFRKALSLLIDREKLTKIPGGPENTLTPTGAPLYFSEPVTIPTFEKQDVKRAFAIFESLGWKLDHGKLIKNGKQFKMEIIFPPYVEEYLPLLRQVAKAFNDAGIDCKLREENGENFWNRMKTGEFDEVFIQYNDRTDLVHNAENWITNGEINYTKYSNKAIDQLFESLYDPNINRGKVKKSIQSILMEDVPQIPLFYRIMYTGCRLNPKIANLISQEHIYLYYLARVAR
jgi:ABC-type transport system substrate-binding protein